MNARVNATPPSSLPQVLLLVADWEEPTWRAQVARERLRRLTRVALAELALRTGEAPDAWPKDADGAPTPLADGRHWSVSHAGGFAAAALSRGPRLGVDVEPASRVPSDHLVTKLRALGARADDARGWLAAWCRVEAALKCFGLGIGHLSKVRLEDALVRVGDGSVMTRLFDLGDALLAVGGGGVCAMDPPEVRSVGVEVAA